MPNRRKTPKSKYTADRNMPGTFEGETVTRRNFMNLSAQGAGAIAVAGFTLPALGFALAPVFHQTKFDWQPIGPPSDFPDSTYQTKVIVLVPDGGAAHAPKIAAPR